MHCSVFFKICQAVHLQNKQNSESHQYSVRSEFRHSRTNSKGSIKLSLITTTISNKWVHFKGFFPFAVLSHTYLVLTFYCNLQLHNSLHSPLPLPPPDPNCSALWDPQIGNCVSVVATGSVCTCHSLGSLRRMSVLGRHQKRTNVFTEQNSPP